MAKIQYIFDNPPPRYFREHGFFKNPKTRVFVCWCFERCCSEEREIFHDGQKIKLKPYQFIFGRKICSDETGLTEDEVRAQVISMEKCSLLKKAPNKTPKRFTIHEWSRELFFNNHPQVNPQLTPKKPPSNPHNTDISNVEKKNNNSEVVFFQCLSCFSETQVPSSEKQWITDNYPEDTVKHAVKYTLQAEIKTTLVQALKWACKSPPTILASKEESFEKNKILAKQIEGLPQVYRVIACNKYLEIAKSPASPTVTLDYDQSHDTFIKKCFENSLATG